MFYKVEDLCKGKIVQIALIGLFCLASPAAYAVQPVFTLHAFIGSDGSAPSVLVQGSNGDFYGAASVGGANGNGTVFTITHDHGNFTPLHSFSALTNSINVDGAYPVGLALDKSGSLWGVTEAGGLYNLGTAFQVRPDGAFHLVHAFGGTNDGAKPSSLTLARDGNLYGTTRIGGANGTGAIFKITPDGSLTTLYSFTAERYEAGATPAYFNEDGANPTQAPLVQGKDGALYGITSRGGPGGLGTIFKITLNGVLTRLRDGGNGYGRIVLDNVVPGKVHTRTDLDTFSVSLTPGPDGSLYGAIGKRLVVNLIGGAGVGIADEISINGGSLFRMTSNGVMTLLYAFPNFDFNPSQTGYLLPQSPAAYDPSSLVLSREGLFYGAARAGGLDRGGILFRLSPDTGSSTGYSPTTLYSPVTDGAVAQNLLFAGDGNLYGTGQGGPKGDGVVFEAAPTPLPFLLHSFSGPEGFDPISLIQAAEGNLYGVAFSSTMSGIGQGTVFTLTPDSTPLSDTLQVLHRFSDDQPNTGLIQLSDGSFYGTTRKSGMTYRITTNGLFTNLYGLVGTTTYGGVIEGPGGLLYGTTVTGGAFGGGSIYTFKPATHTTALLHSFTVTEGTQPVGSLLLASDGNFYGVTSRDGLNAAGGTVYRITPGGDFKVLHRFDSAAEPVGPVSGLVEGTDGWLYGSTNGTYFSSPHGTFKLPKNASRPADLTVLHVFSNQTEGDGLYAGLVQAPDGNFYGILDDGPISSPLNSGSIFKMTPGGDTQLVVNFRLMDGAGGINHHGSFVSRLILGSDGNLYGVAPGGGLQAVYDPQRGFVNDYGTIFRLATARPTSVAETAATNVTGQVQVIRGGFNYVSATQHFVQQMTLKNVSPTPITGPISLILDNLSRNSTLYNKTGDTMATSPTGSPYVNVTVGSLNPGAIIVITLEFRDPTNKSITYSTRVLAGSGQR